MAINKVVYDKKTLIDLTADTVTADKLAEGITAHGADGTAIVGTMRDSGIIDVDELPTTDINTNAVYRTKRVVDHRMFIVVVDGFVGAFPEYADQMGVTIDYSCCFVDALPSMIDAEVSDKTTGQFRFYVLNETGVGYMIESSDGWKTVGEAMFGDAELDRGYVDSADGIDVNDDTQWGWYTVGNKGGYCYSLYIYKDGEWIDYPDPDLLDRVIDMDETDFPPNNLQKGSVYRVKSPVPRVRAITDDGSFELGEWWTSFYQAWSLLSRVDYTYLVVDQLPTSDIRLALDVNDATGVDTVYIYILSDSGACFVHDGEEFIDAVGLIGDIPVVGWVDAATAGTATAAGTYAYWSEPTEKRGTAFHYAMSDGTIKPLGYMRDSYDLLGYEWDDSLQGYVVYCNNTGFRGTIEVPAEYNGSPVLGVKENGFNGSNATALILPDGLTHVFSGGVCGRNLKYLHLPDSITNLSVCASGWISNSINVPYLRLPSGLTYFGAFMYMDVGVLFVPETIKDVSFNVAVDDSAHIHYNKIFFEGKPDKFEKDIWGASTIRVDELYVSWPKEESPIVTIGEHDNDYDRRSMSFEEMFPNSKIYYNYNS